MREMTKEKRIKKESKRLRTIFQKVPSNQMILLDGVFEEASNIRIVLQDLRKQLDETGWVEMFSQSAETEPYERTKPSANLYNSLNKNYQNLIKMLKDSLPKDENLDVDDEFDDL